MPKTYCTKRGGELECELLAILLSFRLMLSPASALRCESVCMRIPYPIICVLAVVLAVPGTLWYGTLLSLIHTAGLNPRMKSRSPFVHR